MKKMLILAVVTLSLGGLQAVVHGGRPAAALGMAAEPVTTGGGVACAGTNLLFNGSFEGQYSSYVPPGGHPDCPAGICTTAQMAAGWTPWWRSHDPADPDWIIRMPEYKPASPIFTNPVRVRSGEAAQQYFTFFSTHEAGFYQQVSATPGERYCLNIWGHSWSAQDDNDAYSGPEDGQLAQRIGIDPTGGTNWQSGNIIWGPAREQYDEYGRFGLEAVAQASVVTVFVYSQPAFAVKHNDVYWDDALLAPVRLAVEPVPLVLLADVARPGSVSMPLLIHLSGFEGMSWTAAVEPGGTMTPGLSPSGGPAGQYLLVTVDSTGLGVGSYSAVVRVTADQPAMGSPQLVPVELRVLAELAYSYLPGIVRP